MSLPEFVPSRRDLWTLRSYYFVYAGGTGLVGPFLNLFLVSQHMDGVQIGWIVAFGSAVALIAAPLWTRLSALSGRPLRFLQVSILLTGLVGILLSQQQFHIADLWAGMIYLGLLGYVLNALFTGAPRAVRGLAALVPWLRCSAGRWLTLGAPDPMRAVN